MLKDNPLTSRELNRATVLKFFEIFFFEKVPGRDLSYKTASYICVIDREGPVYYSIFP